MQKSPATLLALSALAGALMGISECNTGTDADGDGQTSDVDCDDQDASTYPGAPEVCDNKDNNCDGIGDEGQPSYSDDDGDGFGAGELVLCTPGEFYASNATDCDDTDPSTYPGAPDAPRDGIDQSCDGTDGLAPSVGLPSSNYTSIQAALNAAAEGQTVWVGPGHYPEFGLTMLGKGLILASTDGHQATVIDAQSKGSVLLFNQGEDNTSVVRGFTLTGGLAEKGGAVLSVGASPVLETCVIQGNKATSSGGGFYFAGGAPMLQNVWVQNNTSDNTGGGGAFADWTAATLEKVTFTQNIAPNDGGGLHILSSDARLSQVDMRENRARIGGGLSMQGGDLTIENSIWSDNQAVGVDAYGGAMSISQSHPTLTQVTFVDNTAAGDNSQSSSASSWGGAISLFNSSPTLTAVTFVGNQATGQGGSYPLQAYGGGMYLYYSSPTLNQVTFLNNQAISQDGWTGGGGGMYLNYSSPTLSQVTFSGNRATGGNTGLGSTVGSGGGMSIHFSHPTVSQATFAGNQAFQGGGIYARESSPTLLNCILAYNTGLNLAADGSSEPVLAYTNLYNRHGASHNLDLSDNGLEVEPGFVAFSPDGDPFNDDLHLQPGSPMINAGNPLLCSPSNQTGCDPDGSIADLGAFGGAGVDLSYYADQDSDHYYDGWELMEAGNLTTLDGTRDSDGDGLTDSAELYAGTGSQQSDSDGDGFSDGAELTAAKDPLNPFSVPGRDGLIPLNVPSSQYPTLQAAVDAVTSEGTIRLSAGTYSERLRLSLKSIVLEGAGENLTELSGQQQGSVMTLENATLVMSGVTLRDGKSSEGGGLNITASAGALTNVTLEGNESTYSGGGMYLSFSYFALTQMTFSGNKVLLTSGGGLFVRNSFATLNDVTFSSNEGGKGGGIYLFDSHNVALTNVVLTGNYGSSGGGIYLEYSHPTLHHTTFTDNFTGGEGGAGMYLKYSNPTMIDTTFSGNKAYSGVGGGGMFLSSSDPTLLYSTFTDNQAIDVEGGGGGMYLHFSDPTLTYATFTGNWSSGSEGGGGIAVMGSNPVLTTVTLTNNGADVGYGGAMALSGAYPVLHNCILAYNKGGNLYRSIEYGAPSTVTASFSVVYNPSSYSGDTLSPTGTYLSVEPKFLTYVDTSSGTACAPETTATCVPDDLHLALGSPLVNAGDPALLDADGSRSDIGHHGGPGGDLWDADLDGLPDYFWPGDWTDAPPGFDPGDYDCEDGDGQVQGCGG